MSGFEELPLLASLMSAAGTAAAGTAPEAIAGPAIGAAAGMSAAELAAIEGAGSSVFTPGTAGLFGSGGQLGAGGLLSGGGSKAASPLVTQMGMGLLNPQQPPQQQRVPMGPPMMGGGQSQPLQMPYSNEGPPPGMSMEEWLRRKHMMGRA